MKSKDRQNALHLRRKGNSLRDIANRLGVAKSTVSLWTRDLVVSTSAHKKMWKHTEKARKLAAQRSHERRQIEYERLRLEVIKDLESLPESPTLFRFCAALLYWCEGGKTEHRVVFTNSDPKLVYTFLRLMRRGFKLDEQKFRVCLHLHEYHDEAVQKKFWSQITAIPLGQFMKCYRKPHTGKNQRPGYPGCVAVNYYDAKLFYKLRVFWEVFAEKNMGA